MAYFGDGSNLSGVSGIPTGGIIMWSGATSAIPSGWVLCDGQNSTPDLRNKFIVGASAGTGDTSYPGVSVGATGGQADAVVVSHSHTIRTGQDEDSDQGVVDFVDNASGVTNRSGMVNSEGVSGTNKNLPPYYALAYIMKT
tara:strand:+ start:61 stop:483 length:423 start_codon:yes stop_codon:yes gene_type:complete